MMLVQKPPSFNLNASPVRHRRHPSSPPVVLVQPTQIPGLLSLSRPQQQQQHRSSLRPKVAPSTPSPASKSRPAKDKHATPPSRSTPSQAEGLSDPFLVPPQSSSKSRSTRRRQPIFIPAPSAPSQQPQTARSVPLPHHRPAKRTVVPEPLLPAFNHRVCDDMSDHEDSSDAPALVTPTRPKQHLPQQPQPSANSKRRPRHHKRVPSDSCMVFHMSSDESGPENVSNEINDLLMQFVRSGMHTPPPAQRESMYEVMAQREVQGYFASSSFQNSPSPEELPDPEFV